MKNRNQIQAFLRAKIIGAIHSARAAANLTHQGVKGNVLEILVRDLFRPLLPADVGVGTGQIIECETGKLSKQIDIVLYDKSILPPILFDESIGIFPLESVLYTIEVKTRLTRKDLQTAHNSALELRDFNFLYSTEERVRSVIFALDTDLSGNRKTDIGRYKEVYKEDTIPIVAICIAGKAYWFMSGTAWVCHTSETDNFDEILGFLGGIMNTYPQIRKARGQPTLGNYILNQPTATELIPIREKMTVSIDGNNIKIT
ncbi:MAG: DUF6602 domain-containing protein, partial [Acetobacter aceti]